MAKIVMGIGMSHSPLLALEGERWVERGNDDRQNNELNTIDGRLVPYREIERASQARYASEATEENFIKMEHEAQRNLDRLADDLERVKPDVAVIIGDDHYELFSPANMPTISIYHGEQILTHQWPKAEENNWRNTVAVSYAMDEVHAYPCEAGLGESLIKDLIARDFDVSSAARVEDPKVMGFGHAFGFVIERIFRGKRIPVVPVMLNTYFPPNTPTPKRCFNFGAALCECIEVLRSDQRIVVIASGGLSHFVVEEELDRKIVHALVHKDAEALRSLPIDALKSGSSEILCWVAAASAFFSLPNRWINYIPARRTPAGTGIGLCFGAWF